MISLQNIIQYQHPETGKYIFLKALPDRTAGMETLKPTFLEKLLTIWPHSKKSPKSKHYFTNNKYDQADTLPQMGVAHIVIMGEKVWTRLEGNETRLLLKLNTG